MTGKGFYTNGIDPCSRALLPVQAGQMAGGEPVREGGKSALIDWREFRKAPDRNPRLAHGDLAAKRINRFRFKAQEISVPGAVPDPGKGSGMIFSAETLEGFMYICSQDYRIQYMPPQLRDFMGGDGSGLLCHRFFMRLDHPCPCCIMQEILSGHAMEMNVQHPVSQNRYVVRHFPVRLASGEMAKLSRLNPPPGLTWEDLKRDRDSLADHFRKHSEKLGKKFKRGLEQKTVLSEQDEQGLLEYQEKLKRLTFRRAWAEGVERRRIATGLHDRVSQPLASLKIKLELLTAAATREGLAAPLQEISQTLKSIIQETRSLTFDLSPPILYELGVEAAIEWLIEKVQTEFDIQIEFQKEKLPKPLHEDLLLCVFQATREVFENIVQHSKALHARVSLQTTGNKLRIEVEDNGIGFNMDELEENPSGQTRVGIFGIHERLQQIGGRFQIESHPGHGTRASLEAPLTFVQKEGKAQ